LPANHGDEVFLVLDVDSERLSEFDDTDAKYLNEIVKILEAL